MNLFNKICAVPSVNRVCLCVCMCTNKVCKVVPVIFFALFCLGISSTFLLPFGVSLYIALDYFISLIVANEFAFSAIFPVDVFPSSLIVCACSMCVMYIVIDSNNSFVYLLAYYCSLLQHFLGIFSLFA